jgi:sugar O-acyltransferase (sialic acid O-acetyltransferase NeuD family)
MKSIILIGGGGHCKSVIDVIEQEGRFEIVGIVDKPELLGSNILGYSVIGSDFDLDSLAKKYQYAIITVGQIKSPALRIKLFNMAINAGFKLPTIISPRSYVSQHSTIGKGVIVMHDALINVNVKIGENCIINSKALIEHDVTIQDHCHISTGSIINGGALIKNRVFFGSNSTTRERVVIDSDSVFGAGSLILK